MEGAGDGHVGPESAQQADAAQAEPAQQAAQPADLRPSKLRAALRKIGEDDPSLIVITKDGV